MRHIVRDRSAEFPEAFKSLWLAGSGDGVDSCAILISRCPPGHRGPRLHTHPSDQFYFVIDGETTVQIGAQVFIVPPMSLVHFPAGVPHCNWNDSSRYETHLEVIVPRPDPNGLLAYFAGEPPLIRNAAALIHTLEPDGWTRNRFASQHLATRATGSEHCRIYAAIVDPGARGPPLHFHDFDQFYFILKGTFAVQIGHDRTMAETGDLVVLPKGIVHENWNASQDEEMHLTIIVPEPKEGSQFDYKVHVEYDGTSR